MSSLIFRIIRLSRPWPGTWTPRPRRLRILTVALERGSKRHARQAARARQTHPQRDNRGVATA
jgi:hypothetical protein